MSNWSLLPEQASTFAGPIDGLLYFLIAVTVFFTILIAILVVVFSVKYQAGRETNRENPPTFNLPLEIIWTGIPFIIVMGIFVWSTAYFFHIRNAPSDSLEIYVVGKQWMWKLQHPEGQREINQLHIPINKPVKLIMTSQDVIHNFSVPAFRVKQDVVPGTYTMLWFQATKVGTYHLFCSQYCGTSHASMTGQVIAMEPAKYEEWLAGGTKNTPSMSGSGQQLFEKLACVTCHQTDSAMRAPQLRGIAGSTVLLKDGRKVLADDSYIRESILNPAAKVVKGYDPIMPSYQGQIEEETIQQLVVYIKSLK